MGPFSRGDAPSVRELEGALVEPRPTIFDYPLPRNVPQPHLAKSVALPLTVTVVGCAYLPPSRIYRSAVKEGMKGHEVYALQVLLNDLTSGKTQLVEDGIFGEITGKKLRGMQKTAGLVQDGKAGPLTNHELARRARVKAEKAVLLPTGTLQGLIGGESSEVPGCVNYNVPGGVDAGLIQDRVYTGEYASLARWRTAFGYGAVLAAAQEIRKAYERFLAIGDVQTEQWAWELAILNHNWPWGADQLAHGHQLPAGDAQWVISIGVVGVRTPAQWAEHYIDSITVYITSYTT